MNSFCFRAGSSVHQRRNSRSLWAALFLSTLLLNQTAALAHGRAGNRVFLATLAVEDPAVADELTLPSISHFKEGDEGWVTETEAEFSKRLTKDFGLSMGGAYVDSDEANGWDNIDVGAKYQFYKDDAHETILSAGLEWAIGNSGSDDIGEPFSTLTPVIFFGKGLGDLGDEMALVRPLGVTGAVGVSLPMDRHTDGETNPSVLEWGFTLQYSVPYLQQHVRDVGLPQPLSQVTPVVEFAMETPLDGDDDHTTGTINPGFIWSSQSFQIGAEAIFPVNNESGDGVGARIQLHFYLDDIFPQSLGRPLWD